MMIHEFAFECGTDAGATESLSVLLGGVGVRAETVMR